MRSFKDKKGFTLIELLAVIVVLGIVMVIATTTVLPYMANARKSAFATEANGATDAAAKVMSLINIGSVDSSKLKEGADYKVTTGSKSTVYCFSLKQLATLGIWTKDVKQIGTKAPLYNGYVEVTVTGNAYTYKVVMTNYTYSVVGKTGQVADTDVTDYNKDAWTETNPLNCNHATE